MEYTTPSTTKEFTNKTCAQHMHTKKHMNSMFRAACFLFGLIYGDVAVLSNVGDVALALSLCDTILIAAITLARNAGEWNTIA